MLGVPGAAWHLEFTHRRHHTAGRAPTRDNLLVFYLPDRRAWQAAIDRMMAAGYWPVPSFDPLTLRPHVRRSRRLSRGRAARRMVLVDRPLLDCVPVSLLAVAVTGDARRHPTTTSPYPRSGHAPEYFRIAW